MLSLGRNPGEYIMIGDDIVVQVISMDGTMRLAVEAPKDVKVVRGEVYEQSHPMPTCIRRSSKHRSGKKDRG